MTRLKIVSERSEPEVVVTEREHDYYYREYFGRREWWMYGVTPDDYIAWRVHGLGGLFPLRTA